MAFKIPQPLDVDTTFNIFKENIVRNKLICATFTDSGEHLYSNDPEYSRTYVKNHLTKQLVDFMMKNGMVEFTRQAEGKGTVFRAYVWLGNGQDVSSIRTMIPERDRLNIEVDP